MGEGDIVADPGFLSASVDQKVANFQLKPGSPAQGKGRVEAITPWRDLAGRVRGCKPTIGAYQQ